MFWWENMSTLIDLDELGKFIPRPGMSMAEKLNAVTRFAMYYSVILILVKQSVQSIYIFMFVALCTIAMYYTERSREAFEHDLQARLNLRSVPYDPRRRMAYWPTRDNPFMNVSYGDAASFPSRPPAANVRREDVRREMHKLYAASGPPEDDRDVYGARSSERQFYTMPSTTIPNDQETFARWLYAAGRTAKESHMSHDSDDPKGPGA